MNQDYSSSSQAPSPTDSTPEAGPYPPRQVRVRLPAAQPVVTYVLIGINVVVFALQWLSQSFLGVDYPSAIGLKVNEYIIQGQYWRLFTPMFLHASVLHIGFNMYALYILGPGLERYFGARRFLGLYLLSGLTGNVLSFLLSPNPSLGASTAIFGLIGAEIVFFYLNRKIYGQYARRALINIISIAVINLVIGVMPGMNIDNWGHIGGLLGGTLFTWFGGPLLEVTGFSPDLSLTDKRREIEIFLAGAGVSIFFLILAGIKIYSQGGFG